jgi:NADPH:quinone reductase-like Zn-dependent oxidoreductase
MKSRILKRSKQPRRKLVKAIVYTRNGRPDVFQLQEVEKPAPKDDQVLVKVHAASLNAYNWRQLNANPFLVRLIGQGLLKHEHTKLDADIAGRVEAVGGNVKRFKPGDDVFGDTAASGHSGFAEYVCASENTLALKPANLSFEAAAAVPMAGIAALQGLRDIGRIQPGQKVLLNGASGGVGTFAVQIAKYFGADVTAVCGAGNMDMARSLGADHVIDYAKEDFTQNSQRYDVIFAVNGYHPISAYKRALTPAGIYVMAGGSLAQIFQAMLFGSWMFGTGGKKMGRVSAKPNHKDLAFMRELIEAGKVVPVIDRSYPLSQTADAFRYLGEGHARGKIVITLENNDSWRKV